ncbi:hypothetical protein HPB48_022164 [Haemaphysalis longicornis]|uniref:Uncharacterized protein n=1 Tax=Haemaphysalis longicornis TaxID=44386 RepID=A0A9J6FIX1_HAELO|nr:hypothetical protein HPB48_022164 [Haemaphysalis longicornis]
MERTLSSSILDSIALPHATRKVSDRAIISEAGTWQAHLSPYLAKFLAQVQQKATDWRLGKSGTAACQRIRRALSEIQLEGVEGAGRMEEGEPQQQQQQRPQDELNEEVSGDGQPKHAGDSNKESRLIALYKSLRFVNVPPDTDPFVGFWDEAAACVPEPEEPWSAAKSTGASPPELGHEATSSKYNGRCSRARQRAEKVVPKLFLEQARKVATDELTRWAVWRMYSYSSILDIPTAVSILKDLESPSEVHEYVRNFFGSGQDAVNFGNEFLQRRQKWLKKCSAGKEEPAAVSLPRGASPGPMGDAGAGQAQESSSSKKKKTKMHKVDNSMLGFTQFIVIIIVISYKPTLSLHLAENAALLRGLCWRFSRKRLALGHLWNCCLPAYLRIPSEIQLEVVQRAGRMEEGEPQQQQKQQEQQQQQQRPQDQMNDEVSGDEQPKHAGDSDKESRLIALYKSLRFVNVPPDTDPFVGFWDEAAASVPGPEEPCSAAKPTGASPPELGHEATSSKYNGRCWRARQRLEKEVPELFLEQACKVATDELTRWAVWRMHSYASILDIPTAVSILKDLESPSEVQEHVKNFFGSGQDAVEFGNEFLQRRRKWLKKCAAGKLEEAVAVSPPREASPGAAGDAGAGQAQGPGRSKKKKKTKMHKVDDSMLGFTVYAEANRLNARK